MTEDDPDHSRRRRWFLSAGAIASSIAVGGATLLGRVSGGGTDATTTSDTTTTTESIDETTTEQCDTTTTEAGPRAPSGTFVTGSTSTSGAPHPLYVRDRTTVSRVSHLDDAAGRLPERSVRVEVEILAGENEPVATETRTFELAAGDTREWTVEYPIEETDGLDFGLDYVVRRCVEIDDVGSLCHRNRLVVPG